MAGAHENVDTRDREKSLMSEGVGVEKPVSTEAIEFAPDYEDEAVKGDDSDGVVDWTMTNFLATFSLSALYVGTYSRDPLLSRHLKTDMSRRLRRLSIATLPWAWISALHHPRHWRC